MVPWSFKNYTTTDNVEEKTTFTNSIQSFEIRLMYFNNWTKEKKKTIRRKNSPSLQKRVLQQKWSDLFWKNLTL